MSPIVPAIGITLLLSACLKWNGRGTSRQLLSELHIPPTVSSIGVRLNTPVEFATGLLLITGLGGTTPLVLAVGMTGCYSGIHLLATVRRTTAGCHCFGSLSQNGRTWTALARSIVLFGATSVSVSLALRNGAMVIESTDRIVGISLGLGLAALSLLVEWVEHKHDLLRQRISWAVN